MSEPRLAKIQSCGHAPEHGALLKLQLQGAEGVRVRGGQYVIVNTGRHNAEGKLIKRAYTLFGVEPCGREFLVAAQRVETGIASQYLSELKDGEILTFSGPWGKFYWPQDAAETQLFALAIGSGITAILGYLQSVPTGVPISLRWHIGSGSRWLDPTLVQELSARDGLQFEILTDFMDEHQPQFELAEDLLQMGRFVLAGEGAGVDAWLGYLQDHQVPSMRIQSEVFYRKVLPAAELSS